MCTTGDTANSDTIFKFLPHTRQHVVGGSGNIAPRILNNGARWRAWSASRPSQSTNGESAFFSIYKNKRNLFYKRNQSVPRCKYFLSGL